MNRSHSLITTIINGIIIGSCAGLVISLFRFLIQNSILGWQSLYHSTHLHPFILLFIMTILIMITLLVSMLVKQEPHIMGSGIPEVKLQLSQRLQLNPVAILWRKFMTGVLMIGTGSFLGREGPSVQLGAAVGQIYAERRQLDQPAWQQMVVAGAAAGLAAAFNAPLAATMFVLEELTHRFSRSYLLVALSSAITADIVTTYFFGLKPVLQIHYTKSLPLKYYGLLVLLGLIAGLLGYGYQFLTLHVGSWFGFFTRHHLKRPYHTLIMLVFTVGIGLTAPYLLGGSSDLIQQLPKMSWGFNLLLLIFMIRLCGSTISFGSGAPGGIFLPILTLGAVLGAIVANSFIQLGWLPAAFLPNFIIFTMAGYFAGISQAPLTAIMLITEMVGSLVHLLPLALVSLTAYLIVNLCHGAPIYDALADQLQHKTRS